uniref:Uncharacterized protein n=1 Tax=Amphimedon queenslandica TaxID=400682 RepID=A0A1X7ST33_AMPQE
MVHFTTPLIEAATEGHNQVVELLLTKGADPNFTSKYTGTPLTEAAKKGHHLVVELLLSKGANPNITNKMST